MTLTPLRSCPVLPWQMPWKKIEAERHNKSRTPKEERLRVGKAIKKDKQRQQKIKEVGVGGCRRVWVGVGGFGGLSWLDLMPGWLNCKSYGGRLQERGALSFYLECAEPKARSLSCLCWVPRRVFLLWKPAWLAWQGRGGSRVGWALQDAQGLASRAAEQGIRAWLHGVSGGKQGSRARALGVAAWQSCDAFCRHFAGGGKKGWNEPEGGAC